MATPRKVIRDYRYEPEAALAKRKAVIAQQQKRYGDDPRVIVDGGRRVLPPYYPREPIDAGDAFSESGQKVAFSELDDELQALILAGGGGGDLRVRELDGSPDVDPVDDIRVPNGSIVAVAGSSITFLFADYAGSFELAPPGPGTGDIATGRWGFWYDTTNDEQYLVRNRGGTLFYVELAC